MMKNLLVKSLALSFVFTLVACEKNKTTDNSALRQETTTPHSMETEPATNSNQLHDDMQHDASVPVTNEDGTSEAHTGSATTQQTP
ncbi:hypothetical protein F993_01167 [Acinetobacter proteolyticus]|jgi:hypothetical protein|uniref:Lipoprotein n=2 Tax=Acinetobacter proteolyticus TaxID=1776741 RepID=A0A653K1J3_9GAMM|nr:hypothetical protein [Acinetobacter proteolyticus]ENU24280.1 hypothetical protein F993_01167 [Acinetobacter proteolyticus]WEI18091.1 hypothetical protein PY247_17655 [Acinetobacter proteolyticus]VXA54095.1 conserved exported hypothetical protein [Acinetobacter proteolyticus]